VPIEALEEVPVKAEVDSPKKSTNFLGRFESLLLEAVHQLAGN
jgi:hypothetical protein